MLNKYGMFAFAFLPFCFFGASGVENQEVQVLEVPGTSSEQVIKVDECGNEYAEVSESYDVEVTRWIPETKIETRTRVRKLPVFRQERMTQMVTVCEDFCTSVEAGVVSVPKVIRRGPVREFQRNQNFVVDGFAGGTSGTVETEIIKTEATTVKTGRVKRRPVRNLFGKCMGGRCGY